MDAPLTQDELQWLERIHTDSPTKPEPPATVKRSLVDKGLAIELVEGGLQLTTLGRERLTGTEKPTTAAPPWPDRGSSSTSRS